MRPPTEATLLGFCFFTSRFTLPHPAGDQGTVARSYVRASVAVCARALCRGTLRLPSLRATGPRWAPKHGDALLAGLVRCRRCGRKLMVRYTGTKHNIPRYSCWRGSLDNGEPRCIAFGGLRVDDAIAEALLRVAALGAIAAALEADAQAASRRGHVPQALGRDRQAARHSAARAFPPDHAARP